MKRDGDIASMFRKHAAKKRASVSSPVVEEQNQEQEHLEERVIEEVVGPTPTPPTPSFEPVEDVLPSPPIIVVFLLNYLDCNLRFIMLFSSCAPNCWVLFMKLYRIPKWILPVRIYIL